MNDFSPVINRIQDLVRAKTPGEALEKIRAMVKGYSPDDPPDDDREVLVRWTLNNMDFFAIAWHEDGEWQNYRNVVRWWELPR